MENEILDDELDPQQDKQPPIRYATFGARLGASLIDSLILLPFVALNFHNLTNSKIFAFDLLNSLLFVFYKPLMEWKYGATFGKMALKIKVVNEQFQSITLDQSVLRFLFYFILTAINIMISYHNFQSPAFLEASNIEELMESQLNTNNPMQPFSSPATFLLMFSVMFVLFDMKKQALHDKLAKTFCIYSP